MLLTFLDYLTFFLPVFFQTLSQGKAADLSDLNLKVRSMCTPLYTKITVCLDHEIDHLHLNMPLPPFRIFAQTVLRVHQDHPVSQDSQGTKDTRDLLGKMDKMVFK